MRCNDDHIDRRRFLRNAARASFAGAGLFAFGGVGELLARSPGLRTASAAGAAGSIDRPFHMVTLGDSIMWGQGLADRDKFRVKVHRWLEQSLGRPVAPHNYSHSGAIILPTPGDCTPDPTGNCTYVTRGGEVNVSPPSINAQALRAAFDLQQAGIALDHVDLVLLDGGINDVGVDTILWPYDSIDSTSLRAQTQDRCTSRMRSLLPLVVGMFPTAKVVVSGYYPIISDSSPVLEVTGLLGGLGLIAGFPLIGGVLALGTRGKLIEQSQAFYEVSTNGISAVVAEENVRNPGRVFFAESGIGPRGSYGTEPSLLWRVGEDDPARTDRAAQCSEAGKGSDPRCLNASAGHPNPFGAQAYFDKIIAKLYPFRDEWTGYRSLIACVDPKPVNGQASTVTVWVEDKITHRPVQGTVTVGGQPFDTNKPFTYTFGCTKPSIRRQGRELDPTPAGCTEIVVTAPGYLETAVSY